MSIISKAYLKVIEDSILHAFSSFDRISSVVNYLDLFRHLDVWMHERIRNAIVSSFETIDALFKASTVRKARYYTKGKYPRRLMTIFGEIRFEREYYVPKRRRGEGFFFVDREFDLPRYDYFDALVKALLVEQVASHSYAAAGKHVAALLGSRLVDSQSLPKVPISRQTVHNIFKRLEIQTFYPEAYQSTPAVLHLHLDEKFVASQNHHQRPIEIKLAVVHEGVEFVSPSRNRLKRRFALASVEGSMDLRAQIADYLSQTYDVTKLRWLVVSGDGASWIQSSCGEFRFHPNLKVVFVLDRFHTSQAINRLSIHPNIRWMAAHYLHQNKRKFFLDLCRELIFDNPNREEQITQSQDYLIHHWAAIQNQKLPVFQGCGMEGQVSHIPTPLFASRPMGHSFANLKTRLALRILLSNGVDLVSTYFQQNTDLRPEDDWVIDTDKRTHSVFDATGHRVTPLYQSLKAITSFQSR